MDRFEDLVTEDSIWHGLTVEERKEVTRIQLGSFLTSAEYADDDATETAIGHIARVFW
jgi:hypothetical protein